MSKFVPREIGLDHMEIPAGVTINYATWTIVHDGTIVHHTERDEVNLTSKVFTDVFEIGKTYYVTLSMNRTDGPTVTTKPFKVVITATDEVYRQLHIPSIPDAPRLTLVHDSSEVPINNIMVNASPYNTELPNALYGLAFTMIVVKYLITTSW